MLTAYQISTVAYRTEAVDEIRCVDCYTSPDVEHAGEREEQDAISRYSLETEYAEAFPEGLVCADCGKEILPPSPQEEPS